jgi:sporulation protein YlmC with PRC-barrel domain
MRAQRLPKRRNRRGLNAALLNLPRIPMSTPLADLAPQESAIPPRSDDLDEGDLADQPSDEGSHLMGLVTLTGTKIVNYENETLGTVADLMFDLDHGRISYAVMTSGGFLGMGGKHFAIPWGVLEIDKVKRCLVLDADAATFEKSPGFNPGKWSESQPGDVSWQDKLHRHYRSKPERVQNVTGN